MTKHLLEENHPQVDYGRCINGIQQKIPCRICEAVCHVQALEDPAKPDFDQCDDCGICVAQCPARAITGSTLYTGQLLELAEENASCVILGCRKSEKEADCKKACLAAYPWEMLAALILGGSRLSFLHGKCEGCEYERQMVFFRRSLEQLCSFLGNQAYTEALGEDTSVEPKTRREAFRGLLNQGRRSAAILLPKEWRETPDSDLWRKLLLNRMKLNETQKEKNYEGNWTAPLIKDTCRACGICTKVCPNKALHVVKTEEGSFFMVHFGWKCGGCGLCKEACPWKCIEDYVSITMEDGEQPMTTRTLAHPCISCGEPAVGSDKCIACMLKERGN